MRLFCLISLIFLSNLLFAENTDEKLWTQFNLNGSFPHSQKIKYVLRSEIRLIAMEHAFETGIAGYAMAYEYQPNFSFWLGYQWDSQNQISGSQQQNRLWQQLVWDLWKTSSFSLSQRLRLEERYREDNSQTAWRLRERLLIKAVSDAVNPISWDEIFLNLNHPTWVNSSTINQNRYFIGIEIPHNHHTLEIGYLNQYSLGNIQNTMSHILLLNFNIRV